MTLELVSSLWSATARAPQYAAIETLSMKVYRSRFCCLRDVENLSWTEMMFQMIINDDKLSVSIACGSIMIYDMLTLRCSSKHQCNTSFDSDIHLPKYYCNGFHQENRNAPRTNPLDMYRSDHTYLAYKPVPVFLMFDFSTRQYQETRVFEDIVVTTVDTHQNHQDPRRRT
jgi:hypothetical protein